MVHINWAKLIVELAFCAGIGIAFGPVWMLIPLGILLLAHLA